MKKGIVQVMITLLLLGVTSSLSVCALNPSEDSENDVDVYWGCKLRDYVYDDDGNPIITTNPISDFHVENIHKKGNVESVHAVALEVGPNRERIGKQAHEKFVAVEVVLGMPVTTKKKEFSAEYTLECQEDIKDVEGEIIFSEGDKFDGKWSGTADYKHRVIENMSTVENDYDSVLWEGDSYGGVNSVMSFENIATFAVKWAEAESPKYMGYTTDTEYSGLSSKFKKEQVGNYHYLAFLGTPLFKNEGRLVIQESKDDLAVFEVTKRGELKRLKDSWYDKNLSGYVVETDQLGEYVLMPASVQEDELEPKRSTGAPKGTKSDEDTEGVSSESPVSSDVSSEAISEHIDSSTEMPSNSTAESSSMVESRAIESAPIVFPLHETSDDVVNKDLEVNIKSVSSEVEAVSLMLDLFIGAYFK